MVMDDDFPSSAFPAPPVMAATGERRGGEGRPEVFRWRYQGGRPTTPLTTPADVSSLLGMPLGAIPKPVLDKVADLVDEVELLRAELSQARHHVHWLEDQSDQDSLLPVLHRRSFLRELGRLTEQSERAGLPGTLVLLHVGGIDLLRSVHGLEAGDAALLHVAGLLKAELRQIDLVGYLDNGDFVVALALAEDEGAEDKARRLSAHLTSEPFEWQGKSFLFTVLAGQAHFRPGDTPQSLLAAADAARRGKEVS